VAGLEFSSHHDPVNRCQLRPGAGKNLYEDRLYYAHRRVASSRASIVFGWNVGACAPASIATPACWCTLNRFWQPQQVSGCRYPCSRRFAEFLLLSSR